MIHSEADAQYQHLQITDVHQNKKLIGQFT